MNIQRKCDFNNITTEEIITYKFAATIKDQNARDKFIKGPLKIQLVLKTIELDNYKRKYGDKKPRNKNPAKIQQTALQKTNRSDTQTKHENENQPSMTKENFQTGSAAFAEIRTGHWNTYAQHEEHNVIIAKRWDILSRCANPRPSVG